jgi:hypothetical protein
MAIRKIVKLDVANTTGTGATLLAKGTTAQRPESPVTGYIRYNTTLGIYEQYTPDGWSGIASPPVITSISPTTFNGEQGTTITVNGSNFTTGAVVAFITIGGSTYNAAATTYVNAGQLTATTSRDFTVAEEPLSVKVTNANGLSSILSSSLDCGASPSWTTSSGSLGSATVDAAGSFTIAATDPDTSATLSYSVTSGSLPTNYTLNSSSGVISGTVGAAGSVSSDTTYSFTATATDNAGNTATRNFSITITATNYFGSGSDGSLST